MDGTTDDVVIKYDPDSIVDEIVAHNERHLLLFQSARGVSITGNLDDQDGLFEYKYLKLQFARNIRLLGYSATSDCNEVRFHISEKSIDDIRGRFIAISYCWGGEKPTEYLPISSRAYLKVTKTVYSILRHVSGVASGLPVWIDAICINQADCDEKNDQVTMMGDIYAAARCVLVWLGNGNLNHAGELALLSHLASPFNHNNSTLGDIGGFGGVGNDLFGWVLRSHWFERAWIVQELCFARKVLFLCGAVGMSLPFLKDYMEMRRKDYNSIPDSYSIPSGWGRTSLPVFQHLPKLCAHRELIQENGGKPLVTLTDILLEFQSFKATDPRDKVFAFLGLAAYHDLQPDYRDSIGSVFTKAMIVCSPSLYDYRILGYAGLANPRIANPRIDGPTMFASVPTWVPDFSRTFFARPFTLGSDFKATSPKDFSEAALESTKITSLLYRNSPGTFGLFLKTAFIDTIEEMSKPGICSVDSPCLDQQAVLKQQYDIINEGIEMLKRQNLHLGSKPVTMICFETVTTGGFRNIDSLSDEMKAAVLEAFQESKGAADFPSQCQEDSNIMQFFAHMHTSGIGRSRRLFTTQEGRFGMANGSINKGDRVCLVSGAPVPFVLRGPIANYGKYAVYHLVCDAYVYGVMYGEASDVKGDRFETILLE
jgi:hypothetical protein